MRAAPLPRRLALAGLALTGIALAAAAPARAAPDGSLQRVLEAGVLRLGVQVEGTAAASRGAAGLLQGYLPELGRRIAHGLGVRPDFVDVPRGEMLACVLDGRADVGLGGAIASPWIALTILLSDPIMEFELVALTQRDLVARGMADLRSLSVGVIEGRSFFEAVRAAGVEEGQLVVYPDWERVAQALDWRRREVAIVPAQHVRPIQRVVPQVVQRFALGSFIHCAVVRPGEHDLLRALNVLLYLLRHEGELDGLHRAFFDRSITRRRTL